MRISSRPRGVRGLRLGVVMLLSLGAPAAARGQAVSEEPGLESWPLRSPAQVTVLPQPLQAALARRGCLIPAPPPGLLRDSAAGAVVDGIIARASLLAPGSREWVIVCALGERREMLIYADSATTQSEPLAVRAFFFREAGDDACEASFRVVGPAYTAPRLADGELSDVDATLTPAERTATAHDGLVDPGCDGASVIHYWTGARWVLLPGTD